MCIMKLRQHFVAPRTLRATIGDRASPAVAASIVVPYELYELYDWGKVPKLYGTL